MHGQESWSPARRRAGRSRRSPERRTWPPARCFRKDHSSSSTRSRDPRPPTTTRPQRSEEHTSELQSHSDLVCRLLLEKKKNNNPTRATLYSKLKEIWSHRPHQ